MSDPLLDRPGGTATGAHASGAALDPAAPRPPLTIAALGLFAAALALLTGGWLMLAPFAIGYQPQGAEWAPATVADFVTSLVLLSLGVISTAGFTAGLVAALRSRPTPAALGPQPPQARAEGAAAPLGDDPIALLRLLLAGLDRNPSQAPTAAEPPNGPHRATGSPTGRP